MPERVLRLANYGKHAGNPPQNPEDQDLSHRFKAGSQVKLKWITCLWSDYFDGALFAPDPESDGDYFETLADGTVVLRKGKKKIDISKLSEADLRKLGIDPRTMSKEEIARILKVSRFLLP